MLTGACLCGSIRWTAAANPKNVHHCHCGMCRRWTGAGFATLVWFEKSEVHWAGSAPSIYRASPIAQRGHCPGCGSPLFLVYDDRDDIALTAGSLDEPDTIIPTHHYGIEGRLPWVDIGMALPGIRTREKW